MQKNVKVVTISGSIFWMSREQFDEIRHYKVPVILKARILKNFIVSNQSFFKIYIVSVYLII